MSMLQAALTRECVARNYLTAVAAARGAERDAVVAAIHAAFKPEQPTLEKLVVTGKLLQAAPSAEMQKRGLGADYERRTKQFGSPYCTHDGLEIYLGTGRHPERLILRVSARTDTTPLSAEIEIHRDVFRGEQVAKYHDPIDASEVLARLMGTLAKHVVLAKAA